MYDITNGLSFILNEILKIFQYCFNLLDNITFNGFSLLDFCTTIVIFGAILPILVSVIETNLYAYKTETRKAEKQKEKEGSKG